MKNLTDFCKMVETGMDPRLMSTDLHALHKKAVHICKVINEVVKFNLNICCDSFCFTINYYN